MSNDNKIAEGKELPGDNPNKANARPRQSARPKTKNSPSSDNKTMKLGWMDPLPQVDVIYPLGLEPNVESIPAGEVELDFNLPETISQPFVDTVTSIGDKIQLTGDELDEVKQAVAALGYFKAARQLYSTMLDHEKSANQPLKAVYYDETPIPAHMAGALGIIGHMKTKVGDVMVKDATLLFRRWVAAGLNKAHEDEGRRSPWRKRASDLVWLDKPSLDMIKREARLLIANLVTQRYTVTSNDGTEYIVSMPQLTDQNLDEYYDTVNNNVPDADRIRTLVAGVQCTLREFRDDALPHNEGRGDLLAALGLEIADGAYEVNSLRDEFETWMAKYTTDYKWRVETIFRTGPPPAGTTGYGAQTVSSDGNVARWQFPLSDADVNIGYLFSPSRDFKLYPRMIGYSKRRKEDGAAAFANADAKKFYAD